MISIINSQTWDHDIKHAGMACQLYIERHRNLIKGFHNLKGLVFLLKLLSLLFVLFLGPNECMTLVITKHFYVHHMSPKIMVRTLLKSVSEIPFVKRVLLNNFQSLHHFAKGWISYVLVKNMSHAHFFKYIMYSHFFL